MLKRPANRFFYYTWFFWYKKIIIKNQLPPLNLFFPLMPTIETSWEFGGGQCPIQETYPRALFTKNKKEAPSERLSKMLKLFWFSKTVILFYIYINKIIYQDQPRHGERTLHPRTPRLSRLDPENSYRQHNIDRLCSAVFSFSEYIYINKIKKFKNNKIKRVFDLEHYLTVVLKGIAKRPLGIPRGIGP